VKQPQLWLLVWMSPLLLLLLLLPPQNHGLRSV
jgi:hypothetical protein